MSGHFQMASVLKLVMMESHATPDDLTGDKGAAQILHRQLFDAHEPNLLDEDGEYPPLNHVLQLFPR
jgi:nitrogen-specific signal transduction histidine kinase